jgi:hypothetical protein
MASHARHSQPWKKEAAPVVTSLRLFRSPTDPGFLAFQAGTSRTMTRQKLFVQTLQNFLPKERLK